MKRPRFTVEFKKEVFDNLAISQPSLNKWINEYGRDRPHGNITVPDKDTVIVWLKVKLKQAEEGRGVLLNGAVSVTTNNAQQPCSHPKWVSGSTDEWGAGSYIMTVNS